MPSLKHASNATLNPLNRAHQHSRLASVVVGLGSVMVLAGLTGCQATKSFTDKFDNGSLAYQQAELLEPVQMPAEQEAAAFNPLYPLPNISPNTIDLQSESGKRYELPPPYRSKTAE